MFMCSDERTLYTRYVMTQLTLELALYTKYVMTQPTLEQALYTKYVMTQLTLETSFVYEIYKYIAGYKLKIKNDKKNTGG